MPVWIAVELLDFGSLSLLISGMDNSHLASIGRDYGSIKPPQLISWARSLSNSRNVCAHHSRLWNKPLVNQPSLGGQGTPDDLQHIQYLAGGDKRLYSIAAVAQYMLRFANPRTSWKSRFVKHMDTFPESDRFSLSAGGFPPNWTNEKLWK